MSYESEFSITGERKKNKEEPFISDIIGGSHLGLEDLYSFPAVTALS